MQNSRLLLADLNFYCHRDISNPEKVLDIHAPSDGYAVFLQEKMDVFFVKHAHCDLLYQAKGGACRFFKGNNRFWHMPVAAIRYVKQQRPGIVLVQGLVFPLQVILLSCMVGRKTTIIVQHHGERPFTGLKRFLQKIADKFTDAYIFTSKGNAAEWVNSRIIKSSDKCHEILEASSSFVQQEKNSCRSLLNMKTETVFLWVGRLHPLKDPLTVLKAFDKFLQTGAIAKLYMIYQAAELLPAIQQLLDNNTQLKEAVKLVGKTEHDQLAAWYSAADFFVSGSHKEGSGYALLEAMACGCIPVVTAIPSFKKITGNGAAGFLFEPGDEEALHNIFCRLDAVDKLQFSQKVKDYFSSQLSFKKIAEDIFALCKNLQAH